ncbi:MAG TPA: hypothetical protein VJ978_01525 [Nitriliruptoraceae bacterium]|nr:hypothetical protein [Nitriliruptoraceae bacterium]
MDDGPASRHPDGTGDEPGRDASVSPSADAGDAGIDPRLLQRARGLTDVPLDARASAFDELNRDVVTALRAIEEL